MLKDPYSNSPYTPSLHYFLSGIQTYDLEHTLGKKLRMYNPNIPSDREAIIRNYILPLTMHHTHKHKHALFRILESAVKNHNYDFDALFETDYENEEESYCTVEWERREIEDPRAFFEDIYKLAKKVWAEDLTKAESEKLKMTSAE